MPVQSLPSDLEHLILACLFLCSLWRPPRPLNCWSTQKYSQGCWFGSCHNADSRIRTVPGYLWLTGLTWLQAGTDCQEWYRKDICPGDIVVGPHHSHLQLAFYSPEAVVENDNLLKQSLEWRIKRVIWFRCSVMALLNCNNARYIS